jgi:hypothetical protein
MHLEKYQCPVELQTMIQIYGHEKSNKMMILVDENQVSYLPTNATTKNWRRYHIRACTSW